MHINLKLRRHIFSLPSTFSNTEHDLQAVMTRKQAKPSFYQRTQSVAQSYARIRSCLSALSLSLVLARVYAFTKPVTHFYAVTFTGFPLRFDLLFTTFFTAPVPSWAHHPELRPLQWLW